MSKANFKVGERYENRKGAYEVISIAGDKMVIKWDTGEQIETDVKGQHRVLQNMEQEFRLATMTPGKSHVPKDYGILFKGLADSDFKTDIADTHWRSREQLGGSITRLIAAPFPVQSYSVFKRPELHWADETRYRSKKAWLQGKFAVELSKSRLWAGFYIERSDKPEDDREDWDRFLAWLLHGGETMLAQIASERGLIIRDKKSSSASFPGRISRVGGQWQLNERTGATIQVPCLHAYLSGLNQDEWLDLLIIKYYSKADAITLGANIASDIGGLFTALMPVYEATIGRTVNA